jgi:hypothetical protein
MDGNEYNVLSKVQVLYICSSTSSSVSFHTDAVLSHGYGKSQLGLNSRCPLLVLHTYNLGLGLSSFFALSCFLSFVTTTWGFSSCGPVSKAFGLSSGLSSEGSDGSANADGGGFWVLGGILVG